MFEHTVSADPPADDPRLEPTPEGRSVTRTRVSRVLLAVLLLTTALLIGAAVLWQRAEAERRDAVGRRDAATADLATQRSHTADSDLQLSSAQTRAADVQAADSTPLATAQQATQLVDQGIASAQQMHAAALAGNDRGYNAAVARANALVDQIDAASAQLSTQIDQMPPP